MAVDMGEVLMLALAVPAMCLLLFLLTSTGRGRSRAVPACGSSRIRCTADWLP